MGYPDSEIERVKGKTDRERVELVERVLADFNALDSRRKRAVNPRELVELVREAIR